MTQKFIKALQDIVGIKNVVTEVFEMQSYLKEPRNIYQGKALGIVIPSDEAQISEIVVLCEQEGIAITPQGGNTGMVAGQISFDDKTIIMSMSRMNKIIHIDEAGKYAIVQSGVVLQNLHDRLTSLGLSFPIHIGSQGSCQIGGLVSTNAGGINVLGHGTMRAQIFDLEAIIGQGKKIGSVKPLHKNNVGYDTKQLFIGAEGTLGVVSHVCLRLKAKMYNNLVFMCSVESPQKALDLYALLQSTLLARFEAFELIKHNCLTLLSTHMQTLTLPKISDTPYYVLCEIVSQADQKYCEANIEKNLDQALQKGIIQDAIIAKSKKQIDDLWLMRHSISYAQRCEGAVLNHDIAVPISQIPAFLDCVDGRLYKKFTGIKIIHYGHLGDGNLHYNIIQPEGSSVEDFLSYSEDINCIIYDTVIEYNGTISAEHGIGVQKKHHLSRMKSPDEIALMKDIKKLFDPCNIFNPGKIM